MTENVPGTEHVCCAASGGASVKSLSATLTHVDSLALAVGIT